jgi:hypothetical protein
MIKLIGRQCNNIAQIQRANSTAETLDLMEIDFQELVDEAGDDKKALQAGLKTLTQAWATGFKYSPGVVFLVC